MSRFLWGLAALASAWSAQPLAEDFHAPEAIRTAVADFLEQELEGPSAGRRIEVNTLDPRLRLARCEAPLEMSLPPAPSRSGSVTVNVRCPGPRPWSLYVPTQVKSFGPAVVLATPVAPGTPLRPTDLRVEERDVSTLAAGYFSDPSDLVGRSLKRALPAGQPVAPSAVATLVRVKRGERIVLVARLQGLDVRMQGLALRDGSVGETIDVRNLSSQRVVAGRIGPDGTVEVTM